MWSTTEGEDHSAIHGKQLKNRTDVDVVEGLGVKPFSVISAVVYVVPGKYRFYC